MSQDLQKTADQSDSVQTSFSPSVYVVCVMYVHGMCVYVMYVYVVCVCVRERYVWVWVHKSVEARG